jgi:hypothetical protein
MASQPPWTNSPSLGGYFVYNPRTDEIVLKDGRHFPRPAHIPRTTPVLVSASYDGFMYTGSPPGPGGNFQLVNARPQAIPGTANQGSRPPVGMAPVGSPAAQKNDTAIGHMRLAPSRTVGQRNPVQHITPSVETPVVFQRSTESQVRRREVVGPPDRTVPGIRIGNENVTGSLFPDYKQRHKDFFKVGRIFLVLWSEPAGGASYVTGWQSGIVLNHLGERVFSKVRRFVVIRHDDSYCNALPINTYGGQGVAKRGVKKSDHCIIWSSRPAPPPRQGPRTGSASTLNTPPPPRIEESPKRGEDKMRPVAIRIDPDNPTEHLDVMSRLNLAGVTTVQYNIKVKSFGMVNQGSVRDLMQQFTNVWGSSFLPAPPGGGQAQPIKADDDDEDDGDGDDDEVEDAEDDEDDDEDDEEAGSDDE